MANISITGRHALLFDDDAGANFVNSPAALVPWGADPSLLIDRHDVRHLLDRVPPRPKPGYVYRSEDEVAEELVVDRERFLDLPSEDTSGPDEKGTSQSQGVYAAVNFSYGSTEDDSKPGTELKLDGSSSCYRPPFPLPDSLLNNLPPTEKVHQIIARTAKFVSEHGGQSEIVLRVKQGNNPTFGFLMPDHHLHSYFRFLVENPNLLKTNAVSDKGALSLLGSVYGSAEDEDDAVTLPSSSQPNLKDIEIEKKVPKQEEEVSKQEEKEIPAPAEEKVARAKKNPSIARVNPSIAKVKAKEGTDNVGPSKPQMVMMEPSSVMKTAMEKIAEFIQRNGRELEAVLINQDRSANNFPFLVPTNAYHPYYLKILEETKEGKKSTDYRARGATPSSRTVSREPSEEPAVPEKFRMSIGRNKKPEKAETSKQNLKVGLTAQEAAAIVNAVTRGVSPSYRPEPRVVDSDLGMSDPGPNKPGCIDDDWIAKTIAKTAALVSSEAASVSKEERIKAERLKRARMFASMIKSTGGHGSAPPLPQLLNKVESIKIGDDKGSKVNEVVNDREIDMREREKGVQGERRHHERTYRKRGDSLEIERSERKRGKYSDEEIFEECPGHGKKRHKYRHHSECRKKDHSSSDEEIERTERKRDRHSYKDRRRHGKERERRHHRKTCSSSDSEEENRHHRRSQRDDEPDRSSKSYSLSDSEEESRRHRWSHRDERNRSSKRSVDERSSSIAEERREDSADVPDDLRAKIRAMLRQTL